MKQSTKDALFGLIVGILLAYILVLTGVITLYEDGSIQFFRHPGWGLCLLSAWGCSP